MLQGVIDILINDSGVQSLVGRNNATDKYKVYPVACPQKEDDPYIILSIIQGTVFTRCKGGAGDQDDTPFDVYCYGKTYKIVDDLFQAVRDAIDLYSGTSSGVKFQTIFLDDMRDGWDKDAGDGLYVRIATYRAMIDVSPGT